LCAFYVLVPEIFRHLNEDRTPERELTPAIQKSIESGTETIGMVVDRKDWISVGVATEYVNILKRSLESCGQ
jgi:dTDP-glucose pyrophosphorylase